MVVFPNCKINLGLRVTGKRADGYHNLETIFLPVSLTDALEINPGLTSKKETSTSPELNISGLRIAGDITENLCYKAWQLIKQDHPGVPPMKMHLLKAIPSGAGLGGGSADGAFTLKLLNNLFELNLSRERLVAYALQLGSDCPFFIVNKPCYSTGRGEILEEISIALDKYYFTLVNPGLHVSTGTAFSKLAHPSPSVPLTSHSSPSVPLTSHLSPLTSFKDLVQQPIETWKQTISNDFEEVIFHDHPSLKKIKEDLYGSGAAYASMTGTGSCVYGIFHESIPLPQLHYSEPYKVHHLKLHT